MADTPVSSSALDSATAGPIPYYSEIPPEQCLRSEVVAVDACKRAEAAEKPGHRAVAFRGLADQVVAWSNRVTAGVFANYDDLLAGAIGTAKRCRAEPPCSGIDNDCSSEEESAARDMDWPADCASPLRAFLPGTPVLRGVDAAIAAADDRLAAMTAARADATETSIRTLFGWSADRPIGADELLLLRDAAEAQEAWELADAFAARADRADAAEIVTRQAMAATELAAVLRERSRAATAGRELTVAEHAAYAEALAAGGFRGLAAEELMAASVAAATEAIGLYCHTRALEFDPTVGGSFLNIGNAIPRLEVAAQHLPDPTDADPAPIIYIDSAPLPRPPGTPDQVALLKAEWLKSQYLDELAGHKAETTLVDLEDRVVQQMKARVGHATRTEAAIFGETIHAMTQRYVAPQGVLFRLFAQGDPVWTARLNADVKATSLRNSDTDEDGFLFYDWAFDLTPEWIDAQRRRPTSTKQADAAYTHCRSAVATYRQLVAPWQAADGDDPFTDHVAALEGTLAFHGMGHGFGLPVDGLERLGDLTEKYPSTVGLQRLIRQVKGEYPHLIAGGMPNRYVSRADFAAAGRTEAMLRTRDVVQDGAATTSDWGAGIVGGGACLAAGPYCVLAAMGAGAVTGPATFDLSARATAHDSRQSAQSFKTGFSPVPAALLPTFDTAYALTQDGRGWNGAFAGSMGAIAVTGGRWVLLGSGVGEGAVGGVTGWVVRLLNGGARSQALDVSSGAANGAARAPSGGLVRKLLIGKANGRAPLPDNPVTHESLLDHIRHYLRWDRVDPVTGEAIHVHASTGTEYVWSQEAGGFVPYAAPTVYSQPARLWAVAEGSGGEVVYINPLGQTARINPAGTQLLVDGGGPVLSVGQGMRAALPTDVVKNAAGETLFTDPWTGTRYLRMTRPDGLVPVSDGTPLAEGEIGSLRLSSIGDGRGPLVGTVKKMGAAHDALMTTAENVAMPALLAGYVLPREEKGWFEAKNPEGLAMMFAFTRFGHEFFGVHRGGQRLVFWMDRGADLYMQIPSGSSVSDLDYVIGALQYGSGNILGQVRGNWIIRDLAAASRSRAGGLLKAGMHQDPMRYVGNVQLTTERATRLPARSGMFLRREALESPKLYVRPPGRFQRGMARLLDRMGMGRPTRAAEADEQTLMVKLLRESNFNGEVRIRPDGTLVRRNFGRTVVKREGVEVGVQLTEDERRTFAKLFVDEHRGADFRTLFGRDQPYLDVKLKPVLNARGIVAFNFVHEVVIGPVNEGLRYSLLTGGDFWNTAEWTFDRAFTTSAIGNAWKCATGWDSRLSALPRPLLRNGVDPYLTKYFLLWPDRGMFVPRYNRDLHDGTGVEDLMDMHIGPGIFDAGGFARFTPDKIVGGEDDASYAQLGSAHLNLANLLLGRPVRGKTVKDQYHLSPQDVALAEARYDQLLTFTERRWRGEDPTDVDGSTVDYAAADIDQQALTFALVAAYVNQEDSSRMGQLVADHPAMVELARRAANLAPGAPITEKDLVLAIDRIGLGAIRLQSMAPVR